MGQHINNEGRFQFERYPYAAVDKFVMSFHDPIAQECLLLYCEHTPDKGLAQDIRARIYTIQCEGST